MHILIEQLLESAPVLTDGAWGTQMQQRGLKVGEKPEAWNLTHPEKVEEVARAYVEAGSRIILTNSFSGNRIMLEAEGLGDRTVEINRAAAEISRRAAGARARVFASMGPTGKMVLMGDVTEDQLTEVFAEQAQALKDGGADGIVIETMAALDEAQCALAAALETGLPVVCCMVFDSGPDGDHTMMGVSPEQAVETLGEAGADVVGANCGQGIEGFIPICRRMRAATKLPLWMKANAGLPEMVDGRAVYHTTPNAFARSATELIAAGAAFVGGCCGTGPEFIAEIRNQTREETG